MDLVNSKILLNLDYPDLINTCKAVPDFFRLCQTPYFWELKARYDFGIPHNELLLVPGNSNQKRYEFIYNIKNPNTGLLEVVKLGSLSLVKYFLKQGADLHAMNEFVLRSAAMNGYLDVVKYLVEQGADFHANDEEALRWAAWYGHLDVVKYLVEQGADLHMVDEWALRFAAKGGHLDIVKYLVEQGADPQVILNNTSNYQPEIVEYVRNFIK